MTVTVLLVALATVVAPAAASTPGDDPLGGGLGSDTSSDSTWTGTASGSTSGTSNGSLSGSGSAPPSDSGAGAETGAPRVGPLPAGTDGTADDATALATIPLTLDLEDSVDDATGPTADVTPPTAATGLEPPAVRTSARELVALDALATRLGEVDLDRSRGSPRVRPIPGPPVTGREPGAVTGMPLDGADAGGEAPGPGPDGGLALGVGAVTAAAASRQLTSTPTAMVGLGTTLASVAPTASRWGPLDRLLRAVAPFRYSRYDDSDPLDHEARGAVFDLVQQSPGTYLSEVSETADLPLSTVRHHARILEAEDLVTAVKVRGKRRLYPAYTEDVEVTAAMNDDATAAVLEALARLGAASVSDLAAEVGRDPSTVSHHLQRLEGDGVVVRERDGRAVVTRLSPEARAAMGSGAGEVEAAAGSVSAGGAD